MVPINGSFNVLLLGAWNPSIFNQRWILDNLAGDPQANITIAFPVDDPTAPRKISFDGINLFPGRRQILLSPDDTTLAGITACADILRKILELLVHTPLGFSGINFHFSERDNLTQLLEVFDLSDNESIGQSGYELVSTKISRTYTIDNGGVLNLELQKVQGDVVIKFNYHYEITDRERYLQLFTADIIQERYQRSVNFCQDRYGLTLEEDTTNDN